MKSFPGGVLLEELPSAEELAVFAADLFSETAAESIAERGLFRVALAGGATPSRLHEVLAASPYADLVAWNRTHVFFGDERCVPERSLERNDGAAREALLDRVPIPPENVHRIDAQKASAAESYEEDLRRHFRLRRGELPRFDLVFLGLGPDGHTASLFPGRPEVEVKDRLAVRVEGAPKPPPDRVTLTLPVLSAARQAVFLVAGGGKADALRRALEGDPALPASRVRPALWLVSARGQVYNLEP